jgi:ectoine hydroxylase-related dioxygenase (phytanoyl-CoA dioxygenase family)
VKWDKAIGDAGFAILPALFSHDYLDQLLQEIEEYGPSRSRAGIRHALHLPPVAAVAGNRLLAEIACEVLGTRAFPFRATLFEKSNQSNWLVVWHQDTALPLRERVEVPGWGPWSVKEKIDYAHAPAGALSQVLALRIHLDDSTPDNGPLRVLPRTHMLGVLNDDEIHALAVRTTPVDCVAAKGGVVVMRPLVVHASSKSRTEIPRRVLHIEYAANDSIAAPLHLTVT